ncbi:MAG: hypothetical protein EB141_09695 [Verrucomicrobia bacterium]|nr:hypothetical protein [Verrucomicrobiota bacterium]NBU07517.1 hypothetical protein [Pseudomonadota bacterium]NDA65255.1 hypothetical protein [Verrucomicrobiota bacterium]NDB75900.1 hypothetical protein [Verrucomicrobiota bacterium]NDE96914.1 hypothetical protein [Verrucomicrobiota bacterium]
MNHRAFNFLKFIPLGLLAGLLGAAASSAIAAGWTAGPLAHEFSLTLEAGTREEWLGPLYYREVTGEKTTWAIPPLFSHLVNPGVEAEEYDFLYPLLTFDRYGAEYRWQLFQLLSFSGGQSQEEKRSDKFSVFPFYFQRRSADPAQNYTALLPFWGTVKGHLMRDEIQVRLFPLYSRTVKKDIVTRNYLAPFFHLRQGTQLAGWQFWPLVGHEHRTAFTSTNYLGLEKLTPGHDKWFAAWPFFYNEHTGIGTTNAVHEQAFLPFYSRYRSSLRDSTSYLWPFFTSTEDREKKYHEWGAPWPFIGFARGDGKHMNRVWPFYSHATNATLTSDFILWPLYKYNHAKTAALERERTRFLLFLYSDLVDKNTVTGETMTRTDCWPLFTARKELDGRERFQLLAPFETIVPRNKSIERNWSPVWSLYRHEKNPRTGAESHSLLWNLFRFDVSPTNSHAAFLFGVAKCDSDAASTQWRWFNWSPPTIPPPAPAPAK